jgi:hypothetical protein
MDTYNDLPKSLLLYCHLRNIFPKTLRVIIITWVIFEVFFTMGDEYLCVVLFYIVDTTTFITVLIISFVSNTKPWHTHTYCITMVNTLNETMVYTFTVTLCVYAMDSVSVNTFFVVHAFSQCCCYGYSKCVCYDFSQCI